MAMAQLASGFPGRVNGTAEQDRAGDKLSDRAGFVALPTSFELCCPLRKEFRYREAPGLGPHGNI